MPGFRDQYRRTFAALGYSLRPRDGRAASRIAAGEKRLGIKLPKALRDYYLVAGGERRFNRILNRLLPPEEWCLERGRLVFMEENQAVVLWGVRASAKPSTDPPVFQGVNDEPIDWHREHRKCSVFLNVMVHWHGAFGGAMPLVDSAVVSASLARQLDRDWSFAGEVNKMRAYHRLGQAICFLKWDDLIQQLRGGSPWRIFAGAASQELLDEMAKMLGVTWESSLAMSKAEARGEK